MRDPFKQQPLSFGQVLYAIFLGHSPEPVLLDNLRYLRRLGVPFLEEERAGSGYRQQYGFDELFDCALALEWLQWGLRPRHVADISVHERAHVRHIGRRALDALDEELIQGTSLAPGERLAVDPANEIFAVLDKGREGREYTYALIESTPDNPSPQPGLIYDDLSTRGSGLYTPGVPLKRFVGSLLIHVRNAPPTRPGRK